MKACLLLSSQLFRLNISVIWKVLFLSPNWSTDYWIKEEKKGQLLYFTDGSIKIVDFFADSYQQKQCYFAVAAATAAITAMLMVNNLGALKSLRNVS